MIAAQTGRMGSDEIRRSIRRFMQLRDLKAKPWAVAADVSDRTLPRFLEGKSNTITHRTLTKLAKPTGYPVSVLTGESPDPLETKKKSLPGNGQPLFSAFRQLTEDEVENLQLIVRLLRQISDKQDATLSALQTLIEALLKEKAPTDEPSRRSA